MSEEVNCSSTFIHMVEDDIVDSAWTAALLPQQAHNDEARPTPPPKPAAAARGRLVRHPFHSRLPKQQPRPPDPVPIRAFQTMLPVRNMEPVSSPLLAHSLALRTDSGSLAGRAIA